ncbi:MAG: creatininase family protein [Sphingobacteriales bacterium]|nr:creatininase family protein [Sphingobacteriales bacterium]OJY86176.1 MAG: hypothetical protein BGP14_17020 [Sphingobacteriales bacterium 44-15]
MIWDQLTSEQINGLDRGIPVLLVVAATEQHGPHLPLATDRLIGEFFSRKLHEEMPSQLLVLPAVAVGCSDHHMGFSGTLSISQESFRNQVGDIIRSVIQHGFHKIILLNSHGGNQAIGQVLMEQLGHEYPQVHLVMTTWWRVAIKRLYEITETGPGGVGHAGEFETSLMLHIAPDLVIQKLIFPKTNRPTFPWAESDMLRGSGASYFRNMRAMTVTGVFGDPTAASAPKGQQITDAVITALQQVVKDLYELK